MRIRLLVCGDRNWLNKRIIKKVIETLAVRNDLECVIHGDCRGADKLAGEAAKELHIPVVVFPADWDVFKKSAGPIRNQRMLDEGRPDIVIGFHKDLEGSKGTKDMLDRSLKARIKTLIHDGDRLQLLLICNQLEFPLESCEVKADEIYD